MAMDGSALALGGGVRAVEGFVDRMQQQQRLLSEPLTPESSETLTPESSETLTPKSSALELILEKGLDVVREYLSLQQIYAVRPGFAKLGKWNLEFPNAYLIEVGLQFAYLPRAQWPSRLLTGFDKPIEDVAEWEPMDAYWPDGTHRMFAQWPLPEDMQEQE